MLQKHSEGSTYLAVHYLAPSKVVRNIPVHSHSSLSCTGGAEACFAHVVEAECRDHTHTYTRTHTDNYTHHFAKGRHVRFCQDRCAVLAERSCTTSSSWRSLRLLPSSGLSSTSATPHNVCCGFEESCCFR